SGGNVPNISVFKWLTTTGTISLTYSSAVADCRNASDPNVLACGSVNEGRDMNGGILTNIPWLTRNTRFGVSHSADVGEFFEGGIDVTGLFGGGSTCFSHFVAA